MIAVKNVEVVQVDYDKIIAEYLSFPDPVYPFGATGTTFAEDKMITTEEIKGRQFVNERGETVVIGWNKDTQDVLGLPFRVFEEYGNRIDEQARLIEHLREKNHRLEGKVHEYVAYSTEKTRKINAVRGMTFWQRLKFLFTRELPDA